MKFWGIVLFITLFIIGSVAALMVQKRDTLTIGLLTSHTGTMAKEEKVIADMVRFAVDEINAEGGINHQKVVILEYDGKSDPSTFAKGAEWLIDQGASTLFGCWTSASRKAVKPVLERKNGLLFYPVQYEGGEKSDHIVYLGASANQQINPTLSYIQHHFGDEVYVVGSDYIYPRMAGVYIDAIAQYIGLNIVGRSYVPLGSDQFAQVIEAIRQASPKAIISTINGESNRAFFKALYDANMTSEKIPVFSMSLDQSSVDAIGQEIGIKPLLGHYATWSYFDTIDNPINARLKAKLHKRFGSTYRLTDAGYMAYLAVRFWKNGIQNIQIYKTPELLSQIRRESLHSANGIVYIDRKNNHLSQTMRIAQIGSRGFDIRWSSQYPILPHPYPSFKPKFYWEHAQERLYREWGRNWEAKRETL